LDAEGGMGGGKTKGKGSGGWTARAAVPFVISCLLFLVRGNV